jgi:hypothetical protein
VIEGRAGGFRIVRDSPLVNEDAADGCGYPAGVLGTHLDGVPLVQAGSSHQDNQDNQDNQDVAVSSGQAQLGSRRPDTDIIALIFRYRYISVNFTMCLAQATSVEANLLPQRGQLRGVHLPAKVVRRLSVTLLSLCVTSAEPRRRRGLPGALVSNTVSEAPIASTQSPITVLPPMKLADASRTRDCPAEVFG